MFSNSLSGHLQASQHLDLHLSSLLLSQSRAGRTLNNLRVRSLLNWVTTMLLITSSFSQLSNTKSKTSSVHLTLPLLRFENLHIIHPLQTQPLRLRNKKPHKKEHTKAKTPKDEIRPIPMLPNRLHHMRHRLGNHKIKQPLRRSRQRNIHRSQSRRGDLRHNDPATWAPSELKEGCEEEDAC